MCVPSGKSEKHSFYETTRKRPGIAFVYLLSTIILSTCSQLMPSNMRCSKPIRAGLMLTSAIRPWHLGQTCPLIAIRVGSINVSEDIMLAMREARARRSPSPDCLGSEPTMEQF